MSVSSASNQNSPWSPAVSATPPPAYATNAYSPDDIKGGPAIPPISEEPLVVQNSGYASGPIVPQNSGGRATINDDSLPEVVTPETTRPMSSTPNLARPVSMSHLSSYGGPSQSNINLDDILTVTPLNLLGDQSDTVDCPFCRRRVETRVQKDPSAATHAAATGLFLTTLGGVVAPYKRQWKHHISHFCTNCNRKVAYRRNGSKEMQPLGTPDHLRQVSKFPAAQVDHVRPESTLSASSSKHEG